MKTGDELVVDTVATILQECSPALEKKIIEAAVEMVGIVPFLECVRAKEFFLKDIAEFLSTNGFEVEWKGAAEAAAEEAARSEKAEAETKHLETGNELRSLEKKIIEAEARAARAKARSAEAREKHARASRAAMAAWAERAAWAALAKEAAEEAETKHSAVGEGQNEEPADEDA